LNIEEGIRVFRTFLHYTNVDKYVEIVKPK